MSVLSPNTWLSAAEEDSRVLEYFLSVFLAISTILTVFLAYTAYTTYKIISCKCTGELNYFHFSGDRFT